MNRTRQEAFRKMTRWSLIVALGAAAGFAADPAQQIPRVEQQLVDTMNLARRRSGLAPLPLDPTLSQAAREHSVDMARQGVATHGSKLPDHQTPEDRFQWAFGKSADKLTENVAVLPAGLPESAVGASAHTALNGTAEARRNLLDREVSMMGLGCAEGRDGRIWITAMFARPGGRGAPRQPPATAVPPAAAAGPPTAQRLEELLVRAINEESAAVMLMAVSAQKLEPLMCQAAREHSVEMMQRGAVTHDSDTPGHETPMDRYEWALGTIPEKLSENPESIELYESVAMAPRAPEKTVVDTIMAVVRGGTKESVASKPASEWPEGYRRMRDVNLKTLGVGCAVGSDGRYWVTVTLASPPQSTLDYEGTLAKDFAHIVEEALDLEAKAPAGAAADGRSLTKFEVQWRGKTIHKGDPLPVDLRVVRGEKSVTTNGWGGQMSLEVELGDLNTTAGRFIRADYGYNGKAGKMEPDGRLRGAYEAKGSSLGTADRANSRQPEGFWGETPEIQGTWEAIPADPRRREYQVVVTAGGSRIVAGTLWRKGVAHEELAAVRPPPISAPAPAAVAVAEPEAPAESDGEERAADIRWLKSIDEALATAERKLLEARFKLIDLKEIIGQREQRIAYLESLLAKPRTPESDGIIESIIRMGIDGWDEATMGPAPTLGARPRAVIQGQIDRLKQQISDARTEQDELIQNTLETYYDPIAEELAARGQDSKWDEIRKAAKDAIPEVKSLKSLAEAQLYFAAGQDEKFTQAVQASIADGRHAADARYLQALHFLDQHDLRRALESFRLVMDLTKSPEGTSAPVTTREQAEALAEKGDPLWQQARRMAAMVENGYLQAVDAKASAEAQQVQLELGERLKAGGDEGWLGGVLGYLKMGVVTATSAIVGQEDALEDLATKYEKEVASQHCGLLLLQSLHERGFPLDAIGRLTNEQFLAVMRDYYGEAGAKLQAADGVHMRAAIKAALRNPDVSRLLSGSKELLRVDSGRDYFGHEAMKGVSLDSWSNAALMGVDLANMANVAMMVMPASTFRVSGKVAGVRYTGVLGEAEAGAAVQTAREGFLAATRLSKVPALLEETRAGQVLVGQARQFLATSGWTKNRALEITTFLAAGATGEAVGGTIGVMQGTDGKTEAEAGRMLAELFTMWTAGDADALKEAAEAHGISPEQLEAVAKKAEVEAKAAAGLAEADERDAAAIREALPVEPGAEITAEGRQAGAKLKQDINDELQGMRRAVAQGEADAGTFQRFGELGVKYRAAVALETGAEPEARAWLEHVEKLAKEGGEQTLQKGSVARAADDAKVSLAARKAGPAPAPEAPPVDFLKEGMPTLRSGNPLTKDLDELWIAGKRAEALAGYRERYAMIHHMGVTDAPAVKAAGFPQRIGALRAAEEKGATIGVMSKPEWVPHYTKEVKPEEVAGLDAVIQREAGLPVEERTVRLVPIEEEAARASYSDPYWVMVKDGKKWVKVGVFKRSGEGFRDGLARGADLEAEEIYARFAQEFSEQLGVEVPACVRAKMTVETRVVEKVNGVKVLKEVLPPDLQDGLFVRWAPGVDLEKLGPLAPTLFKKQIARDRVLAALFFDHDRKAGNYLVMDLDKLLSLDHSMAAFRDFIGEEVLSDQQIAEHMEKLVTHWRNRADVQPKGLYRLLDEQITVEDMEESLGFLKTLFESNEGQERVRGILRESLKDPDAVETAMRLLTARARVLRQVMEKSFGTAKDLKPIPVKTVLTGRSGPRELIDPRPASRSADLVPLAA